MRKLLVLGNCQARPLGMLMKRFAGFDLLDPIILHLAKDDKRQDLQQFGERRALEVQGPLMHA